MSSPPHHIYSSFDKRWMQVVSKDDIIQILVDVLEICENKKQNEWRRGRALQLNLDSVRLRLEGTDTIEDVSCNIVKILEKKSTFYYQRNNFTVRQNQIVPIEVNDLVTLQYEVTGS